MAETGEQATQTIQLRSGFHHPQAYQGVAATQVVVEEGQRCADGEAVQPERHLSQFHSQRSFCPFRRCSA